MASGRTKARQWQFFRSADRGRASTVANQKRSSIGIVLISSEMITIEKYLRLGFSATNNEAEYKALLTGVAMVKKLGGKVVEIFSDSRLVVRQINGELEAKD